MQKTIGIVILNFKAYQETIKCIASIRNTLEEFYQIVVVDNGSDNNSYEYLKEYYKDWKGIDVIKNKKNLGFAKGNNVGIYYLRNRYHTDFVLLLNSDTVIVDKLYIHKLLAKYKKGIGLIEANILNEKGNFTQPELEDVSVWGNLFRLVQICCRYYDIYFPFQRKAKRKQYLCQIGCAIMLTPDYFKNYQGLYSRTFLYGEELILLNLLDRAGLELAFVDDTYIVHNEGKSTDYSSLEGTRKKEKKIINGCWNVLIVSCLIDRQILQATCLNGKEEII